MRQHQANRLATIRTLIAALAVAGLWPAARPAQADQHEQTIERLEHRNAAYRIQIERLQERLVELREANEQLTAEVNRLRELVPRDNGEAAEPVDATTGDVDGERIELTLDLILNIEQLFVAAGDRSLTSIQRRQAEERAENRLAETLPKGRPVTYTGTVYNVAESRTHAKYAVAFRENTGTRTPPFFMVSYYTDDDAVAELNVGDRLTVQGVLAEGGNRIRGGWWQASIIEVDVEADVDGKGAGEQE